MSSGRKRFLVIIIALAAIGAAYLYWRFGKTPEQIPEPTVTSALSEELETATAVAQLTASAPTVTPIPTPTFTPTPESTITPNIPPAAFPVATPKPRQVAAFTRPQPVIPSILAFINKTDAQLLVFLQGVEDPITILPDASAERQLAPGVYDYTVMGRTGGLALLSDSVALESNERIEITIEKIFSTLSFENQTNSQLTVTLAKIDETIIVPAGATSDTRPLPPDSYVYTAFTDSGVAVLKDEVTLEAGKAVTIVIEAEDVFDAVLSVENQTDYNLTVTLAGISTPIVVAPGQTSAALPLLSGEYDYTVVAIPGNISMSGHLSLAEGEHQVLTIDVTVIAAELSALVIENRTDFELVASLSGMPWTITIPPHSASEERQLPPGEYSYTVEATGGNIAPLSGHITLEKGIIHTLALELTGSRAEVTIVNSTGCMLQITLTGQENLTVSVPDGSEKVINIAEGDYNYAASACGVSDSGEKSFSGKSTWTFRIY